MRIHLDHSALLARRSGQPERLPRGAVQDKVARLAAVQEELDEVAEQGLLDHRRVALDAEAVERGQDWANEGERVVLMGDAGAVLGASLLCPEGALDQVTCPDPLVLQRILSGPEPVHLLALDGPPWVRALAAGLAGRVGRVTVVKGDGSDAPSWELPGVQRWEEAGSADLRFAPFSPLAQALAEYCDVPLGPLMEAWRGASEQCGGRATWDNPALLLAGIAAATADSDRGRLVLVGGDASLGRLAGWAAASWSAITVKATGESGVRRAHDTLPVAGTLGDEALVQRLVEGPDDAWSLLLTGTPGAGDLALDGPVGSVGVIARDLARAWGSLLTESHRPHVRLRASGEGAAASLALATVLVHAALALAVYRGLAPLQMPAADRLRALQRRWMDDGWEPGAPRE